MCGKFFQRWTWREIVEWSDLLKQRNDGKEGGGDEGDSVTPMRRAAVIRLDEEGNRVTTPMRWGWSRPKPGQKPGMPDIMHARAETIDSRPAFTDSFMRRRGLVIAEHFNVAEEVGSKRVQHVVTPNDGKPLALSVLWEKQAGEEGEVYSFVMITVPANKLIATVTDRMPAVIAPEKWGEWLGEEQASGEELKALLAPVEGDWTMKPQEKAVKAKPPKASAPDLFGA